MSLYYSPVYYGLNDVVISDAAGDFEARIYYPSDEEEVRDVAVRPGIYPLVAFAHGDRRSESWLCPSDLAEDYKRWGAVLHLLARCGFVVVSVAVHDVINDTEASAARIEAAIKFVRSSWVSRRVVHQPPVFYLDPDVMMASAPDGGAQQQQQSSADDEKLRVRLRLGAGLGLDYAILGDPTPLGVMGHSWGAKAAARVAVRGNVRPSVIASIAGSWDDNASIAAITGAGLPTLMMVGTEDFLNNGSLQGLWNSLSAPKHQAMLQSIGHWDWFGYGGSIRPCDEGAAVTACRVGWQTASEMALGFMTKYLLNNWWRPPYLLGSPGGRPPLLQWYESGGRCALKVRWNDPTVASPPGPEGAVTLGTWTSPITPW